MKILTIFGTRPEAIKFVPIIHELRARPNMDVKICLTGQHRTMLDQIMKASNLQEDFDLDIMRDNQTLNDITASVITKLPGIFDEFYPDRIMVQGDTSTTLVASLAAFYEKIPVDHIEAGLRSFDKYSPWPEEVNRKMVSVMADQHYAPTETSRQNLLAEGIDPNTVHVTGNTVIDALFYFLEVLEKDVSLSSEFKKRFSFLSGDRKTVLVTCHRRENHGVGLQNLCKSLKSLAKRDDIQIVYPVHLNPNVQKTVRAQLADIENIYLLPPLEYLALVYLMNKSHIVLTDSGGIQEEAPSLGKPVLVLRDTTERPEGVDAGTAKLVGTCPEFVVPEVTRLLESKTAYDAMSLQHNPYGDGKASQRIVDILTALQTSSHDQAKILEPAT